jgi:DNA-binding CsgD family transcriptional regulator
MVMPSVRPVAGEAMHGREPERRVVRDLLRRAQRGTGGVVLVDGEPGIGKSLLLRDCVDEAARHGFSLAAGAADQLTRAIQGYQPTGAAADAARVRSRLRALGVRRRHWTQSARRPVSGWESLTDAERAASELVAEGLNNREVASRMYVSINTVAFYMRQAYRKLSIGSRVELTRIVLEQAAARSRRGPATRSVSPDGAGPVSRGTAAASLVMADRTVVPSNGNHLEACSHGH